MGRTSQDLGLQWHWDEPARCHTCDVTNVTKCDIFRTCSDRVNIARVCSVLMPVVILQSLETINRLEVWYIWARGLIINPPPIHRNPPFVTSQVWHSDIRPIRPKVTEGRGLDLFYPSGIIKSDFGSKKCPIIWIADSTFWINLWIMVPIFTNSSTPTIL